MLQLIILMKMMFLLEIFCLIFLKLASQTITITVENNSDLKCSDSTTLEFIVDDSPEFYEVIIPSNCDDGVSDIDGYSEFDTSSITETLAYKSFNIVKCKV